MKRPSARIIKRVDEYFSCVPAAAKLEFRTAAQIAEPPKSGAWPETSAPMVRAEQF
jgi:hypothetical protein